MKSYQYEHRSGVNRISWERFAELTRKIAEKLSEQNIDTVIGIARAGLFPATLIACTLRRELFPVRVTRRVNDQITYEQPIWKVDLSPEVHGKTVVIVDEIVDTGKTLTMVADRARELGAANVLTAALISHSWADPMPQFTALVTDELVVFPWDELVYENRRWQPHPELVDALKLQGLESFDP